jgi:acylphosphatase
MIRRYQLLVNGKVQGVFFRASAREKALSLNITGWVRNLPDGQVLMEIEGEEADLLKMVEWCRKGPQFARVEGVLVDEIGLIRDSSFVIAG